MWIYDFVHLFKNIRNGFLDDVVRLPNGEIVTVDDFFDMLEVVQSEITSGFHISENDLNVSGNDRQDTRAAVHVLSERTAAILKHHFPNDSAKQALSSAIDMIAKCFKIMTSRVLCDRSDDWKTALRMHYEKQRDKLLELKDFMKKVTFGENYYQKGCIISVNGILDLHDMLKTKYGLPYLKTSHVDQDYVESSFGRIRADSRGGRRKPSALGLGYRLSRYIIDQNMKSKVKVNIFELKDALKITPLGKKSFLIHM